MFPYVFFIILSFLILKANHNSASHAVNEPRVSNAGLNAAEELSVPEASNKAMFNLSGPKISKVVNINMTENTTTVVYSKTRDALTSCIVF